MIFLVFYASLTILALLFGIQLGFRFFKWIDAKVIMRMMRIIFFASVCLIFILLFYYSREQFLLWYKAGPPAQYLVPPFSSIEYFLYYVLMRYWASYLASLAAAILFFYAAKKLNEKYQERFFYSEEYYFLALAIFLTGHPAWILYLSLILALHLLVSVIKAIILKRDERIYFYYLWLPVAILVILLSRWPVLMPLFQALKF
jgi:hypothetical protein